MMIKRICNDVRLKDYCQNKIEDAGISIEVDAKLPRDQFVGIKVDDFYSGLRLGNAQPKAVDFVVSVDCKGNWYNLYVLELKGGKNKNYTTDEIYSKFDTAMNDFLQDRFGLIFCDDRYKYRNVWLYLVATTPLEALNHNSYEDYLKFLHKTNKRDTLSIDSQFTKIYNFRGKVCQIQREIPPNPMICSDI